MATREQPTTNGDMRTTRTIAALFFGVVASLPLGAATAQTADIAPAPATYFWGAFARHSGKCLNVPNRSTPVWPGIMQATCGGGINQQWRRTRVDETYLQISSRVDSQCLTVVAASTADGANVIQSPCESTVDQQ
jgi:hypothetical protein